MKKIFIALFFFISNTFPCSIIKEQYNFPKNLLYNDLFNHINNLIQFPDKYKHCIINHIKNTLLTLENKTLSQKIKSRICPFSRKISSLVDLNDPIEIYTEEIASEGDSIKKELHCRIYLPRIKDESSINSGCRTSNFIYVFNSKFPQANNQKNFIKITKNFYTSRPQKITLYNKHFPFYSMHKKIKAYEIHYVDIKINIDTD